MKNRIDVLKGVHPGLFLGNELKKRNLVQGKFALAVQEYPQTLGAIIKGKRDMNVGLSVKIEKELGLDEGLLMTLQVFYDIKEYKEKNIKVASPDLSKLRKVLFWDTEFEKIDWQKNAEAVIKRILERGNDEERAEIERFYGADKIKSVLIEEK